MMAGCRVIVSVTFTLYLLLLASIVECTFKARSEDDLYYSGGTRRTDYKSSTEFCNEIGGSVPSVHSEEDVSFVTSIVTEGECVWVGGKRDGTNSSYKWDDGSAFDYAPWFTDEPSCDSDCCALCIGTREVKADYNKMRAEACKDSDNVQVCRINMTLTESREKLLESWQKKLTDNERSTLSAYFFLGFLKEISNLDDQVKIDEDKLKVKVAQMNEELESVKIAVKVKNEENGKKIREMSRQVNENKNTLMNRITVTNNSLWEAMLALNDDINIKLDALSLAISEAIETTDEKISHSANTTTAIVMALKEKVSTCISQLDDKVERYRNAVNTSLENNFRNVSDMVLQVGSNLSQQIADIDNKVENYTNIFDEQLKEKQSQESVDSLRSQLETYEQDRKKQDEQLLSIISSLQTEVQQLKTQLNAVTLVTTESPDTTTTEKTKESGKRKSHYAWQKWIPGNW